MAYTPINWATGDTITAEKLNRCDNGWGYENTQLFSETVTTADQDGIVVGTLAYGSQIDAPTLIVTFNGTSYTCAATEDWGNYLYGAPFGEQGPDFSDFPFALESTTDGNYFYTETAGTYTVSVVGASIVTSAEFGRAVKENVPVLRVILGTTTFQEVSDAISEGLFVYGWDDDNGRMFYALNTVTDSEHCYLYALTRQATALLPTTAEFVASSPDSPLYAS